MILGLAITMYCDSGRTASGTMTTPGIVAAGPSWRFGSRLRIHGLPGVFTVADRGGAVTDGVIDVWTGSCRKAWRWGRRFRRVAVLR